jgi:hypothetical protein
VHFSRLVGQFLEPWRVAKGLCKTSFVSLFFKLFPGAYV